MPLFAPKTDKIFSISVIVLSVIGFFIFSSASLGLVAKDGVEYQSVALNQGVSLLLGFIGFIILNRINLGFIRKYAWILFLGALIMNLLLFVPSLALEHGGATRWLHLGFYTFQPSELLKVATIIYCATWLASLKKEITTPKALYVCLSIIGVISLLLIAQSDTDTLVVISTTCLAMLFVSGARLKYVISIILLGMVLIGGIIAVRPYAAKRIMTFINPSSDPYGSSYQIQQSLIAIGSGGYFGKGYGQSVQKFSYLPEPIGDSIFAVTGEEFGFLGGVVLIALFVIVCLRGLKIASGSDDVWNRLVATGIVVLIAVESFMNMSSMLGIIPLSGMPLLFVSHGGTALITILGAAGLLSGISRGRGKIRS